MKCPNCGSTAQVRNTYPPTISNNREVLIEGFTCGCGCHFSVEYQRNNKGVWEHYWTCVDYIKKIKSED